jgi:hypothetical protein
MLLKILFFFLFLEPLRGFTEKNPERFAAKKINQTKKNKKKNKFMKQSCQSQTFTVDYAATTFMMDVCEHIGSEKIICYAYVESIFRFIDRSQCFRQCVAKQSRLDSLKAELEKCPQTTAQPLLQCTLSKTGSDGCQATLLQRAGPVDLVNCTVTNDDLLRKAGNRTARASTRCRVRTVKPKNAAKKRKPLEHFVSKTAFGSLQLQDSDWTFRVDLAGSNSHFEHCLKSAPCAETGCNRRGVLTLPYCPQHLKTVRRLKIQQTTIMEQDETGTYKQLEILGLFAWDPDKAPKDPVFISGDVISVFAGETLQCDGTYYPLDDSYARYGYERNDTNSLNRSGYEMQTLSRFFYDFGLVRCAAAFANTKKEGQRVSNSRKAVFNSELSPCDLQNPDHFPNLTATKKIYHNQEILCFYDLSELQDYCTFKKNPDGSECSMFEAWKQQDPAF